MSGRHTADYILAQGEPFITVEHLVIREQWGDVLRELFGPDAKRSSNWKAGHWIGEICP